MSENSITNDPNAVSSRDPEPEAESPAGLATMAVRPWVRLFARQLDYGLAQVGLVLALMAFGFEIPENREIALGMVAIGLWIFVEAAFLASWGATPGRWILGTSVRDSSGRLLSFSVALRRSFSVWVSGVALGLPLVSIFTYLRGYRMLEEDGTTHWDRSGGLTVRHERIRPLRIALPSLSLAAIFALLLTLTASQDYDAQAIAEVQGLRKQAEEWATLNGSTLEAITPIETSALGDRERSRFDAPLKDWTSVIVIAGCDDDCLDLDLHVLDPDGVEVGRDVEADAAPVVVFSPRTSGNFSIITSMHECRSNPCSLGYQILVSNSPLVDSDEGGYGTCFAVGPDGTLLTAQHVVEGAEGIRVQFADGRTAIASVEHTSAAIDLAVLRVPFATPTFIPLGRPHSLQVGDPIFTLGFPMTDLLGSEPKFTDGSVSSLTGIGGEGSLFQMSVPIQPGNSGGPVVNDRGEAVGIVTSTAAVQTFFDDTGALPQNVNWAVNADFARPLFAAPRPSLTPGSRREAIARARAAVCHVVTGE